MWLFCIGTYRIACFAVLVYVLQTTQNLVVSRCYFSEDILLFSDVPDPFPSPSWFRKLPINIKCSGYIAKTTTLQHLRTFSSEASLS